MLSRLFLCSLFLISLFRRSAFFSFRFSSWSLEFCMICSLLVRFSFTFSFVPGEDSILILPLIEPSLLKRLILSLSDWRSKKNWLAFSRFPLLFFYLKKDGFTYGLSYIFSSLIGLSFCPFLDLSFP